MKQTPLPDRRSRQVWQLRRLRQHQSGVSFPLDLRAHLLRCSVGGWSCRRSGSARGEATPRPTLLSAGGASKRVGREGRRVSQLVPLRQPFLAEPAESWRPGRPPRGLHVDLRASAEPSFGARSLYVIPPGSCLVIFSTCPLVAVLSFSLTKEVYTSTRTRFWRSVIAESASTAISTEVAGWSSGSRIPARTYSVSAETRSAFANCCRTSADGLRSPRSIWLRYGLDIPACAAS